MFAADEPPYLKVGWGAKEADWCSFLYICRLFNIRYGIDNKRDT